MKKLKDIIYDYNDVLVALLIVAVAAGVIYWRVNVVMAYPKYAEAHGEQQEIDIDFSDVDLEKEEVDPIVSPDDEPETTQGAVTPQPQTQPAVEPQPETKPAVEPKPETPPQTQVKKYTLVVSKENKITNWSAVESALKKNGIIGEKDALGRKATEMKLDANLQLGTYELDSSMSLEEIVKILTD